MVRPKRLCEVDGCDNVHLCRGLCSKHYRQTRTSRGLPEFPPCKTEGCTNVSRTHSTALCQACISRCRQERRVVSGAKCGNDGCENLATFRIKPTPLCKQCRSRERDRGFSAELVAELRTIQAGRCALCHDEMVLYGMGNKRECADHDHETGRPRGLLCGDCNKKLGMYEKYRKPIPLYDGYLKFSPADALEETAYLGSTTNNNASLDKEADGRQRP